MATRRFTKTRRTRERIKPRVELLEDRNLLAAAVPEVTLPPGVTILDPVADHVPMFTNPLPNPLDPGFVYQPTGTTMATLQNGTTAKVPLYSIGAYQIQE